MEYCNGIIQLFGERMKGALPGSEAHLKMMGRVREMPATIPANARRAAVLCLLSAHEAQLQVLLIRRQPDNTAHSGQIGFPGGKHEPTDPSLWATAWREAQEEVGIEHHHYTLIGKLSPLYIPVSNFEVHPYLALSAAMPLLQPNRHEVADVHWLSLPTLFAPENKIITDVLSPAYPVPIKNVNAYCPHPSIVVWGATAMILSEVEALCREAGII